MIKTLFALDWYKNKNTAFPFIASRSLEQSNDSRYMLVPGEF